MALSVIPVKGSGMHLCVCACVGACVSAAAAAAAVAVACWRCARESWVALSHVKVISSLLDPSLGEEDGSEGGGREAGRR